MSQPPLPPNLDRLFAKLLEEGLRRTEMELLSEALRRDASLRELYRKYMIVDALLRWEVAPPLLQLTGEEGSGFGVQASDIDVGSAVELPNQLDTEDQQSAIDNQQSTIPPIILDLSPTLHSPVGGFLFSYALGAVLLGIGLLIGLSWRISRDCQPQVASDRASQPPAGVEAKAPLVGRITGMVDCQWADPTTEVFNGDSVLLGREYALTSGFMQITYDTGAKVILQGPATYEVESASSGFLSLGKLTARVEKGSGVRDQGSGIRNQKSDISNPQSLIPNPLFTVCTPTAIVTDLGTEFGVEVDRSGISRAHVFQGNVELQPATGGGRAIRLGVNQSARAQRGTDQVITVIPETGEPLAFTRQLPRRKSNIVGQVGNLSHGPPLYQLSDLGTFGGATSEASGINVAGQVVGEAATAGGATHAFLYAAGKMKDLGTLHGGNSHAYAINAAGDVVGCSGISESNGHAFLYSTGTMKDLGTLGGATSWAAGINAAGQVVGASEDHAGVNHAFLYTPPGEMKDLGALGGPAASSCALGINAAGDVVGHSFTRSGVRHAFLYSRGTMTDLGTLPGCEDLSCAYGINDSGQVAGYAANAAGDAAHVFLYRAGAGMKDLGTLGGITANAFGINSAGQVVGISAAAVPRFHAFLYADGAMIDLNSLVDPALGWTLVFANAINDSGQIVGYGTAPDGSQRAFLLTPLGGDKDL